MEEGSIAKWHKKVGDLVRVGELLFEVATDKATMEFNAYDEGYLRKILVDVGTMAIVNQPVAIFSVKKEESIEGYKPEGAQAVAASKAPEKQVSTSKATSTAAPATTSFQQPSFTPEPPLEHYAFGFPAGAPKQRSTASPLAKKLAKEKGLDLTSVKGSGPSGRVTSHDLDLAQADQTVSFSRHEAPTTPPGAFEEVALTPMRKAIATRLQQSKSFVPHFYVRQEIDAAALMETSEQFKKGGLKITINTLVIRAVALALKENPALNSGFDSTTQSIIRFKTIDIAVAVSLEAGLITPIIRHADYKNLGELSVEMRDLGARAKEGKLAPEEYKGGSFTISNLGMFGVSDFVAIINPPQAAILAIAGIEECVRVKHGVIGVGKRMNLTLSADHRVVDGTDGAKFLKSVQKYLENPALLAV
jgi:pyruvate dehydrogenase E2 component (dihydrolipoamide acetyltransferase)